MEKLIYFTKVSVLSLCFISCGKELPFYEKEIYFSIKRVYVGNTPLDEISGVINDTLTLQAKKEYYVDETLIVNETGVLIIQEGATIYFNDNNNNYLLIERDGKLFVNGSELFPVVFTSIKELNKNAGDGDWAGVHINGNAQICQRNSILTSLIGNYGKTSNWKNSENSGSIRYLRIEYAGADLRTSGAALNLNGVGSQTTLENIQIYKSANHGIRVRGGMSRINKVVVSQNEGTGLRWEAGWAGFAQHLVINQLTQPNDAITLIRGESSNKYVLPVSSPTLSNILVKGFGQLTRGIRLEDHTEVRLVNSIIANTHRALRIDSLDKSINKTIRISNMVLSNNKTNFYDYKGGTASLINQPQNFIMIKNININDIVGSIISGYDYNSLDEWFERSDFIGAIKDNSSDWSKKWIKKN